MSKKEKQLVMNDKETIKSDNFLNNDEIVEMVKSNLNIENDPVHFHENMIQYFQYFIKKERLHR